MYEYSKLLFIELAIIQSNKKIRNVARGPNRQVLVQEKVLTHDRKSKKGLQDAVVSNDRLEGMGG